MYYVSDGFNLDESLENQFTSLLTLNGVRESQSALETPMPNTQLLPNIRSQLIQNNGSPMLHQDSSARLGASTFKKR